LSRDGQGQFGFVACPGWTGCKSVLVSGAGHVEGRSTWSASASREAKDDGERTRGERIAGTGDLASPRVACQGAFAPDRIRTCAYPPGNPDDPNRTCRSVGCRPPQRRVGIPKRSRPFRVQSGEVADLTTAVPIRRRVGPVATRDDGATDPDCVAVRHGRTLPCAAQGDARGRMAPGTDPLGHRYRAGPCPCSRCLGLRTSRVESGFGLATTIPGGSQ
jgi:hypothetical protein